METQDSNLWVNETWVNETERRIVGRSEAYETFTNDKGKLYKAMRREHGRCVSKQYCERKDGSSEPIGWVFQKRVKYEDVNETYIQETWVTVYKCKPVKHVTWEVQYA